MRHWIAGLVVLGGLAMQAGAQAPAGAPAGANGICKDGSYSTAAKKEGACRGHKGVQTWYVAASAAAPAPGAAMKAAPAPAPAPAAAMTAAPAPAAAMKAAPATSSASGKRMSPSAAAASKTQAAGGGPGLVWVNTETKVYHCNGDTFYGKTKTGSYMSEDAAKAAGARGERGKTCAGK